MNDILIDLEIAKVSKYINTWELISPHLGITSSEEVALKRDHPDYNQQKRELLFLWRKRKGSRATLRALATACKEAGEESLCERIYEMFRRQGVSEKVIGFSDVASELSYGDTSYYPMEPIQEMNQQPHSVGTDFVNPSSMTVATGSTSSSTGLSTGQPTGVPLNHSIGPPTGQPTGVPPNRPIGPPTGQPTGVPPDCPIGPPTGQPTGASLIIGVPSNPSTGVSTGPLFTPYTRPTSDTNPPHYTTNYSSSGITRPNSAYPTLSSNSSFSSNTSSVPPVSYPSTTSHTPTAPPTTGHTSSAPPLAGHTSSVSPTSGHHPSSNSSHEITIGRSTNVITEHYVLQTGVTGVPAHLPQGTTGGTMNVNSSMDVGPRETSMVNTATRHINMHAIFVKYSADINSSISVPIDYANRLRSACIIDERIANITITIGVPVIHQNTHISNAVESKLKHDQDPTDTFAKVCTILYGYVETREIASQMMSEAGLPILSPPPPPPSGVVPQYINTGHHPPTHAVNRNINDPSLGNTTTVLREPSPPIDYSKYSNVSKYGKPTLIDMLNWIVAEDPGIWNEVGTALGISEGRLNGISKDLSHGGSPKLMFKDVLVLWERSRCKPYNWQTILEALDSSYVERRSIAKKVAGNLDKRAR